MRYIARRFGYNGTSEIEAARADEATELIYDLRLCKLIFVRCINYNCQVKKYTNCELVVGQVVLHTRTLFSQILRMLSAIRVRIEN